MHESARDRSTFGRRRRGHDPHRHECVGLARLPRFVSREWTERSLAYQTPSELIQMPHILSEGCGQFLQRLSMRLSFAHLLERLPLLLGQRFCRRHRLPPLSRRIADDGELERLRSPGNRRGYWSGHAASVCDACVAASEILRGPDAQTAYLAAVLPALDGQQTTNYCHPPLQKGRNWPSARGSGQQAKN